METKQGPSWPPKILQNFNISSDLHVKVYEYLLNQDDMIKIKIFSALVEGISLVPITACLRLAIYNTCMLLKIYLKIVNHISNNK